jgi:hypothetical protein
MTAINRMTTALQGQDCEPRQTDKGWSAKCPAHDDRRASLSVNEGEDGRVLVTCHAGCTFEKICSALSIEPSDLMPVRGVEARPAPDTSKIKPDSEAECNRNGRATGSTYKTADAATKSLSRAHGKPSDQWTYHDIHGKPVGKIVRWDSPDGAKDIRPIALHLNGWRIEGMPVPRPLYRLPELANAERVFVVEGEKAADAARSIGLVATTSPHGAASTGKADWSPLAGKECVILPDNDDAGRKYADDVAAALSALTPPAQVRIVDLATLPDGSPMPAGSDIVEWIAGHGEAAEPATIAANVVAVADAAAPYSPPVEAWPAIVPFDAFTLPEFPTHALPKVLREWVEAESHATQTPPDLAALLALAVCSATIARWVEVEARPGWREPVNLFVAALLDPANRKSAVFADALRPLREYEAKLIESGTADFAKAMSDRRQHEARLKHLEKQAAAKGDPKVRAEAQSLAEQLAMKTEPTLPRLLVDDATSERIGEILIEQGGRIASMSPEGGVFDLMAGMYGDSKTLKIDVYLKGHSGDELVTDRISRKRVRVVRPSLTCAYAMQPEVIRGLASKPAFRGRGLLARFVYAVPRSWIGRRKVAQTPVSAVTRAAYHQAVVTLAVGCAECVLHLNADASKVLVQWEHALESMLDDGGALEFARDWGGKLAGATLRIAAVMHCVEFGTTGLIGAATLEAAILIARYLIPHAEAALRLMDAATNQAVCDAEYLLRWIERHGRLQFTKHEAQQHGKRRFPRATDIDPALGELARRGYIRTRKVKTSGPGRPQSAAYDVNSAFRPGTANAGRSRNAQSSNHKKEGQDCENIENVVSTVQSEQRLRVTL